MRLDKGILTTLLVLLSLPLAAVGQAVSIAGKSEFAPYTFADFEATGPDNWAYDWEFSGGEVSFRVLDDVGHKVIVVAPPGVYAARLTAVGPSGNEKVPFSIKKAVKTFTIGEADPDDIKPDDGDDKKPAPIPEAGFRVLIVYESKDAATLPREQQVILSGADVREFLEKNCVDENGTAGCRILDQNTDMKNAPPLWQKAMARPRKEVPWVIISNGKTGFEGPLPKTQSAFIDLCTKYLPK